jgi:hypothetical protein
MLGCKCGQISRRPTTGLATAAGSEAFFWATPPSATCYAARAGGRFARCILPTTAPPSSPGGAFSFGRLGLILIKVADLEPLKRPYAPSRGRRSEAALSEPLRGGFRPWLLHRRIRFCRSAVPCRAPGRTHQRAAERFCGPLIARMRCSISSSSHLAAAAYDPPWSEIHALYGLTTPPANLQPRYNICPTTTINTVVTQEGNNGLVPMRWGLIPSWWKKRAKDTPATFNARAETVAEKPMFRSAFEHRRCLIPASGYYEWQDTSGGKQP